MPPIVLFYGPDAAPAQALAVACAALEGALPYDPAALDQNGLCVLVWTDPVSALAHCLRGGGELDKASAEWMRFADEILARIEHGASEGLVLVEAQAVCAADPIPLGKALPLVQPLPACAAAAPRDSAAVLATLMLPHLPGLQQAWQRLRAVSHCGEAAPLAPSELASLASQGHEAAKIRNERDPLPGDANRADQIPLAALTEEVSLLREHLAYLQTAPGLGNAKPPASGFDTATGPLESAIATLLADLVTETDRRIQAEHEAHHVLATLRGHGLDASSLPYRDPVAPRRLP